MTTIAQKLIVAVAVVVGMAFGSGTMDVSALPQQTNHLLPGDKGRPPSVTVEQEMDAVTVPQRRHRIGPLAE